MIQQQLTDALEARQPIVLVGDAAPLLSFAAAKGLLVVDIDVDAIGNPKPISNARYARNPVLVVVSRCETVATDSTDEFLLLDMAFDGHPSLPADHVVVLHFSTPTELSEAFADEAIPCAFIGVDQTEALESTRLAA